MTDRICSIEGCERPHKAIGLCQAHYRRHRLGHSMDVQDRPGAPRQHATCTIPGCSEAHQARGWCLKHYTRWKRQGDPNIALVGEAHPGFTGDDASYGAAHMRVKRARGSASQFACSDCGGPASQWSLIHGRGSQWVEGSGYFSLASDDYEPRCKPCHDAYDRRRDSDKPTRGMLTGAEPRVF
jgi:hypothetical protein